MRRVPQSVISSTVLISDKQDILAQSLTSSLSTGKLLYVETISALNVPKVWNDFNMPLFIYSHPSV